MLGNCDSFFFLFNVLNCNLYLHFCSSLLHSSFSEKLAVVTFLQDRVNFLISWVQRSHMVHLQLKAVCLRFPEILLHILVSRIQLAAVQLLAPPIPACFNDESLCNCFRPRCLNPTAHFFNADVCMVFFSPPKNIIRILFFFFKTSVSRH